jgi:hypothetical protein
MFFCGSLTSIVDGGGHVHALAALPPCREPGYRRKFRRYQCFGETNCLHLPAGRLSGPQSQSGRSEKSKKF